MQSINRVMKIVDTFISMDPIRYLSITELSNRCDLPVSSLHRILQAMIKHKMIKQDKDRKLYTLGTVWLEYGLKVYDTMNYISHIRPELEDLMRTINSSVYLIQPDEDESIIIERIDCINQTIRAYDKLGLRVPFPKGIANLVIFANMNEVEKQKVKEANPEQDWKKLESEIKIIKEQGYALGEDEWSIGIITVATPILNHSGQIFGVLSVKLAKSDNQDTYNNAIKELLDTGNRVSWKLDHQ